MRKVGLVVGATVTAIAMTFSAMAQPLAPGKPAGAHAAQLGDKELLVFGAVGAALAGVLIASDGSGGHPAVVNVTSTIVIPTTT